MVLYSFYLFNKCGDCIFDKQWSRSFASQEEKASLVGGLTYTLQHFSTRLSSTQEGSFKALQTPSYKLHYFETMTGYRAALMTSTDLDTNYIQNILSQFFTEVFTSFAATALNYDSVQRARIEDLSFNSAFETFFQKKDLISANRFE